jgi:hypothetical protein
MPIKIGYAQLEKMNNIFRISADDAAAAAARFRAGIDPISHSVAMAAGLAPLPRNVVRPTEGTSDESEDRPADGVGPGSKPYPGAKQPSTDPDKLVARAHSHLNAYGDPDDDLPKHERLSRAAALLKSAAESMKPKAGSQHSRMR